MGRDEGTKWKNVQKDKGEGATVAERGRKKEGNGRRTDKRWKRYMPGRTEVNENMKGMQKM
jgi:hypothetical protein